jgi:hypothetical protein
VLALPHGHAIAQKLTRIGAQKTENHAHCRRFAGPIGPNQPLEQGVGNATELGRPTLERMKSSAKTL